MPTGEFKSEDGLIPVGEGQWDYDFVAQLGRSFWPLPLYANVDVGYRVRTKNDEIDRDPGDEWFLNAELGYNIARKLMLMGKYELLRSDPSIEFGSIVNRSQIKRIAFMMPVLLYAIDEHTAVEAALRISLNGRNYPAGQQLYPGGIVGDRRELKDTQRRNCCNRRSMPSAIAGRWRMTSSRCGSASSPRPNMCNAMPKLKWACTKSG